MQRTYFAEKIGDFQFFLQTFHADGRMLEWRYGIWRPVEHRFDRDLVEITPDEAEERFPGSTSASNDPAPDEVARANREWRSSMDQYEDYLNDQMPS
jgi:hypothetical protein